MRFKTIGLFGLWDRYRDDWLISPQAERLLLFSTILVLPLTPVFLGRVDPKSLSFWLRLPLSILGDRKSTRLNSSHLVISYAVFCLKKKKNKLKLFVLYHTTHNQIHMLLN